jgi:hypothetical protein
VKGKPWGDKCSYKNELREKMMKITLAREVVNYSNIYEPGTSSLMPIPTCQYYVSLG